MIRIPNTLQEVFNIVSTHLLTQGQKSVSNHTCKYRGPNGLKCAAGALIPDNEYKPEFEQNRWHVLVSEGLVQNKFSQEIAELQFIHDSNSEETTDYLKTELIKFANLHNLTHTIET